MPSAPAARAGRARLFLRASVAVAISLATLAVLLGQLDLDHASAAVAAAEPGWLAAAIGWSAVIVWARGRRWTLLDPGPGLGRSTAAIAVQTFYNRIAPVRLGELALPYLLSRHAGADPSRTLILLVVVRVVELAVAIGLLALSTLLGTGTRHAAWLLGLAAVLAVIISVLAFFRGAVRLALRVFGRLARALRVAERPFVRTAIVRLEATVSEENRLTKTQRVGLLLWTIGNQLMQIAVFDAVLRAFGTHLGALAVIQASSVCLAGTSLPIPSVGTVGTLEASWVAGTVWVGVDLSHAVLTGIAIQVLTLLFAAVVALPSWFYLVRRRVARTR